MQLTLSYLSIWIDSKLVKGTLCTSIIRYKTPATPLGKPNREEQGRHNPIPNFGLGEIEGSACNTTGCVKAGLNLFVHFQIAHHKGYVKVDWNRMTSDSTSFADKVKIDF